MANLDALTFFRGPDISMMSSLFNWVEVVPGSAPSSVSSASYPIDKSWSSSSYVVVAPVTCAATIYSTAFSCFTAALATSRKTLTSAATFSLRLFSANFVTCNLASSFCFCATVPSISAKSGVCHVGGHDCSTEKIASSMVMKGSLVHYCVRSLLALM